MTTHIRCENNQLTTDFNMLEFYYASNPMGEFDLDDDLIQAAQVIRDWIGFCTHVTSTVRKNDTFGQHRYALAIDLCTPYTIGKKPPPKTPEQVLQEWSNECRAYIDTGKSELIEKLRKFGINGFGIEGYCIHFDKRTWGSRNDAYGSYTVFVFEYYMDEKTGQMVITKNYAI